MGDLMTTQSEKIVILTEEPTPSSLSTEEPKTIVIPELDEKLNSLQTDDECVETILQFMEHIIRQKGAPKIKWFWEAKKRCAHLLKTGKIGPRSALFWSQYVDLTKEAHAVKNFLEEQGRFHADQIEKAIAAIEKGIEEKESLILQTPVFSDGEFPQVLDRIDVYRNRQRELNILNAFASRIHDIRKELIKTEMRLRKKNLFFQRLSQLGDQVFPPRKEKIKEQSNHFEEDVKSFFNEYFSQSQDSSPLYFLREQIKALQTFAKVITLNTRAFNASRSLLSQSWDILSQREKAFRKERAVLRQTSKAHRQEIETHLQAIFDHQGREGFSPERALDQIEHIAKEMKNIELEHHDVKALKEQMYALRQPYFEELKEREVNRKKELEREKKRKEQEKKAFQTMLSNLCQEAPDFSLEDLKKQLNDIRKSMQKLSLQPTEQREFLYSLKRIEEIVLDKTEQEILSDDDREALDTYRKLLQERSRRRQEVKNQVEELRRAAGSSGLDFAQAMQYQQQLQEERERLEKMEEGIVEMEKKIEILQQNV